jgi:long-chain acyl-CoA synthetase
MSRIRIAYTAGAAIRTGPVRFYRSMASISSSWIVTETCAYVCLQPDHGVKFDAVGRRRPASKLRSRSRAVLVRADAAGILQAARCDGRIVDAGTTSYRRRGAVRRRRPAQGNRPRKDVGKLAGGAMFAELYRNKLKFFPHKEAVVFGHGATWCVRSSTSTWDRWATGPSAAVPIPLHRPGAENVHGLIRECVERSMQSSRPKAGSRSRRSIAWLPQLDPDDDERRTRKVRRGFVAENTASRRCPLSAASVQHRTLVRFRTAGPTWHGRHRLEEARRGGAAAQGRMSNPAGAASAAVGETILSLDGICCRSAA